MNLLRALRRRIGRLHSHTLVMLVCTFGVVLLALTSATGISWLAVNRARVDLLDQGRLLTERYAAQATLALLYDRDNWVYKLAAELWGRQAGKKS